jgi:hypothetical protein
VVCDKKEGGKTVWDIIMFWILWFLCTRKLGLGKFVALSSFFSFFFLGHFFSLELSNHHHQQETENSLEFGCQKDAFVAAF